MAMKSLVVEDMKVTALKESAFVKPLSLEFRQNGKRRKWDMIKVHDSVTIIIFNITRQKLICVKQFRPAVYFSSIPEDDRKSGIIDTTKYPPSIGITLEFCAGIVDKNKSLAETAREEVLEECGYDVPVERFEKFKTARAGVSTEGTRSNFFYVEVTDDMKVNQGGGLVDEGEVIEVVELSISDAQQYVEAVDNISPAGFSFGLVWFLMKKGTKTP
ncbi:uridine diphosphate glucose pyrophosphatase NUDT14 isoform X2 [Frankliniella occidentalis]|nr:uridine diphosphate glucose pyrophosphatase NUDT14 isoform X2 [Frankliniella occidentalis]XP_026280720.1 uridine diphosphate glucose pyrophosphatase NUDT14 isoform X2 [Frankliniella occidentalis]XP_052122137.1 uridine diphosphate glucose pyrophosphatase NUDT14 isoform X2 [Frankliniella occidentalis]